LIASMRPYAGSTVTFDGLQRRENRARKGR
jgi:hypothetical protein